MATFSVDDPGPSHGRLSGIFRCGELPFPLLDCFKVLWGLADVTDSRSGAVSQFRFDFAGTKLTKASSSSNKRITKSLFNSEISVEDAEIILAKLKSQNVGFFSKLFAEITFCIMEKRAGNHVASFLYLYRAVEWVAVSFPLFYFSRRSDFREVNSVLRDYFSDDRAKELAALNKFCGFIAEQSGYLGELNVTFTAKGQEGNGIEAAIDAVGARMPPKIRDALVTNDTTFEVPYKLVASLIVSARNLLFHNSNSGQDNFDLDAIGGADVVCEMLTSGGLVWLALTFSEIVQDRAARVD